MTPRDITKMVEKFGYTVDRIARNGHYKVFINTPSGKRLLVVSVTGSDVRAIKNNEAILKRWQV